MQRKIEVDFSQIDEKLFPNITEKEEELVLEHGWAVCLTLYGPKVKCWEEAADTLNISFEQLEQDLKEEIDIFNKKSPERMLDLRVMKPQSDYIILGYARTNDQDEANIGRTITTLSKSIYKNKSWSKLVNPSGRLFKVESKKLK